MIERVDTRPRRDERWAAAVWDAAPIAALVVDPAGTVRGANHEAARLLGPCEGRPLATSFATGESWRLAASLAEAVERGDAVCEACVVGVDGTLDVVALHIARTSAGGSESGDLVVQVVGGDDRRTIDRRLAEQRAFRGALLELSDLSLRTDCDEVFYATLLRRAVEVVPGAQAGSLLVREPGTDEYRFVAAEGFDLDGLRRHHLGERELFRDVEDPSASIVRDIDNSGLDPERREWLETVGRMAEVVVSVSAPVVTGGEAVALVSLDNFDDPEAFDETSIEMTTVLGRLIADLSRRRDLESALRRERESFRRQALHDGLTGLANRRHLERRMDAAVSASVRHGRPLSLLFVDVDEFKQVNDTHGHAVGDEVIVAVADRLRRATRAGDTVGRWGGDEFVIVVPDASSAEQVAALGARVVADFREPLELDELDLQVGVSVGAAWGAGGPVTRDGLVRCADAALYDAKAAGKHTVRVALL